MLMKWTKGVNHTFKLFVNEVTQSWTFFHHFPLDRRFSADFLFTVKMQKRCLIILRGVLRVI